MYDERLFGHDTEENIVAVNLISDDDEARVRVFSRTSEGVSYRDEILKPFIIVDDPDVMFTTRSSEYGIWELAGDATFKYLIVFRTYEQKQLAIKRIRGESWSKGGNHYESLYYLRRPEFDFLTHTGKTLFKGMTFDDIYRMQIDIEVISGVRGFPNALVEEDEVIIIAMSDNRGWKVLLHTCQDYNPDSGESYEYEHEIISRMVDIIKDKDPDVIEGHNILGFDLPYLFTRAEMYGIEMGIGRDDSVPRTYQSSQRFAERVVEFVDFEIVGRYVIDTYLQLMAFDVFSRSLQGYGLKDASKHFGFASDKRVYIDGDKITDTWHSDPALLLDYALDDVDETNKLAAHLGQSTFYLTQMIPMPYDRVSRSGPATKIEALFVRWYIKNYTSIPSRQLGRMNSGGYTAMFYSGVMGPIVYADVESLYPAIMLNYDIKPASDSLGIFQELLQMLTDLRFVAKRAMKAEKDERKRSELDSRQSSYKIMINSFYGMLGFSGAAFNDFPEANRVAETGQGLLKQLISIIEDDGGTVVEADTDGVLFIPPAGVITGPDIDQDDPTSDRSYVSGLTDRMPTGIVVGFDGRAAKMLSYKRKNYAILGYDGKLKIKGSSLVSRSMEKFGVAFVKEVIVGLLDGDVQGIHNSYLKFRDRIVNRQMEPAEFSRRETLKDSPDVYTHKISRGERNEAASYKLAIERHNNGGPEPKKGDRISYYVTGSDKSPRVFENANLVENYNGDENSAFYLRRLDEFASKFQQFFTPVNFQMVFGPDNLFKFKPDQIEIISYKVEVDVKEEQYEEDTPF